MYETFPGPQPTPRLGSEANTMTSTPTAAGLPPIYALRLHGDGDDEDVQMAPIQYYNDLTSHTSSPISSDESRASTPDSSRGPSAEPLASRRKTSDDDRSTAKKAKEQASRKAQANALVNMEDVLIVEVGYLFDKFQTGSNGASAGLQGDKLELMLASAKLMTELVESYLHNARQTDVMNPPQPGQPSAEDTAQAQLQAWAKAGPRTGNSLRGTMMDDGSNLDGPQCERANSTKACRVHGTEHGTDDFRACRVHRRRAVYIKNRQASIARLRAALRARQSRSPRSPTML